MPIVERFEAHPRFNGFRIDTGALRAEVIELGGIVTRLEVPDREGRWGNVLLGCAAVGDYLSPHPHFNCLVGRYANRMTNARFALDGRTYALDANVPPHHLHGGRHGFASRIWTGSLMRGAGPSRSPAEGSLMRGAGPSRSPAEGSTDGNQVILRLHSPDGDCGYPGALDVEARYGFADATVTLEFTATADAPTPVSLTAHHYYNLSAMPGTVLDHEVAIDANAFLPVAETLTQLGEVRPVERTPFDLRQGRLLADAMAAPDAQMRLANGGFDHTFALAGDGFRHAAAVRHPPSGRTLAVATDQPGVQLYTGNTLHQAPGHDGRYPQYGGLCLETQQFPDAPNHPNYPNTILRPGEVFRARTEFTFGVDRSL